MITIGRTSSRTGFGSSFTALPDRAVDLFEDVVSKQGGVSVGGVNYNLTVKTYNDASDPELVGMILCHNTYIETVLLVV